jgi:Ca-activated chloride channel family protein
LSFQQPLVLLGLLALPALVAVYLLFQRRRRIYTVRFTNLALLASVVPRTPKVRRHLPATAFLLGLAGLLLGAAGPILNLEVATNHADVALAIDVSGSMGATDVQPTRLDAARAAAKDLIGQLPWTSRVALVAFSDKAVLVSPLTTDRQSVSSALDSLRAGGGTAIGDGLELALRQLATERPASSARRSPATVVLLTDGASNTGIDPNTAAEQAHAYAIPVDTIGIGQRGRTTFIGRQPVEGVDEQTLQTIAQTTGGKYYYAGAADQLRQIYSSLGSEVGWEFMRLNLTIPILISALVVLVGAGLLSLRWFRVFP